MLVNNAAKNEFHLHLFMFIVAIIISLYACSTIPKVDFCQNFTAPVNGNRTPCIDIHGYVLGNIQSGAQVFLYRVQNLDYTPVIQTVRNCTPIQIGRVNDTAEYNFTCLAYGQYVAAIPSTSYTNSSVGSPLAYEFKNENVSIDVVYQGGGHGYLVGAFSINKTHQAQP